MNRAGRLLLLSAIALGVLLAGCTQPDDGTGPADPGNTSDGDNTVTYTTSGFQPQTITVEQGETVTWVNNAGREMWVATNVHPTHRVYPDSNIDRCGTDTAEDMFDACGGIPDGENWSFTFEETGEWSYHDHLRAAHEGTVIVE